MLGIALKITTSSFLFFCFFAHSWEVFFLLLEIVVKCVFIVSLGRLVASAQPSDEQNKVEAAFSDRLYGYLCRLSICVGFHQINRVSPGRGCKIGDTFARSSLLCMSSRRSGNPLSEEAI